MNLNILELPLFTTTVVRIAADKKYVMLQFLSQVINMRSDANCEQVHEIQKFDKTFDIDLVDRWARGFMGMQWISV